MARPARDLVGVGAAATSLLLWSAAFAAIRAALEHFSFGHVVLGGVALARSSGRSSARPPRDERATRR